MRETLEPVPQEIREQFEKSIKETVARDPSCLEEAVTAHVTSGILGPAEEFANELKLSFEQLAFLAQYANNASRLAVKKELDLLAANPLFQLEIALIREGASNTSERERLRGIQGEIKAAAEKVADAQESEPSTDNVVNEILRDKDGEWKTPFYSGDAWSMRINLIILGGEELKERVRAEGENLTSSQKREPFVTPTVFNGISAEIRLSKRNGPLWVGVDFRLDRETVKKLIEAPDLPPLP